MTEKPVETTRGGKGRLEATGIGRVVQLVVFVLVLAVVLFVSAGRLDWLEAWIFVGAFLVYVVGLSIWGIRHDPELLNERGKALSSDVKAGEKALILLVTLLQFTMIVLAGLDAGRFGWSSMPLGVGLAGWVLLIPASVLPAWTMMSNTYAAVVARVQEDRGHQVVTTGPYRYVRHPMYVGVILFGLCVPLALGSWWALIPGGMMSILFLFRTAAEDRLLRRELPGYAEYAESVRYRLVPGFW